MKKVFFCIGAVVIVVFTVFNVNIVLNSDKLSNLNLVDLVSLAQGEDNNSIDRSPTTLTETCYDEKGWVWSCSYTVCVIGAGGCTPTSCCNY